jgi:hypothetical protein
MSFIEIPHDKLLNTHNEDYEMEMFWYGFKSLIKNYYDHIKDDDDIKFIDKLTDLSSELNKLQLEKKFDEIYSNIFLFLKSFIKKLILSYQHSLSYTNTYLFSWLKRYNKIKNAIKLETTLKYNKYKKLESLSEDEKMLLKLKILEVSLTKIGDLKLLQMFDIDINSFLSECLENHYIGIFDYISCRYNIDHFYDLNKWEIKGPIQSKKIISTYFI